MGKLLSDVPAASAILDRLLHHAEVIAITGRSYRVQPSPKPSTTKPKIVSTLKQYCSLLSRANPPPRSAPLQRVQAQIRHKQVLPTGYPPFIPF